MVTIHMLEIFVIVFTHEMEDPRIKYSEACGFDSRDMECKALQKFFLLVSMSRLLGLLQVGN